MPAIVKWLQRLNSWLWRFLLILLPITSMPLVVKLVRSDTVAAPSGIILVVLMILWLLPYLLKKGTLPKSTIPLFVFTGIVLLATILSYFYAIPPYKSHSVVYESLTALLTLAIGLSFYLVTTTIIQDEKMLKFTLRWVSAAGALILLWSIAQAISWAAINRYPNWMKTIHDIYSVGPLFRQRVSGFALEPSWLAHQLNVLFIPYWMAASLAKSSVFRWKIWKFSVEKILLVFGMGVLLLTYSRIGLAALLVMLSIPVFLAALRILKRINVWIFNRKDFQQAGKFFQVSVRLLWVIILFGFGLGVVLSLGYALSKLDMRMGSLFDFDFAHRDALLYYAERLSLAARFIYWQAGWGVFEKFPILGVGLGNSGFFFPETLSPYAWKLTEVRSLLFRTELLLNPKSLWVRLLAESGIIGFSAFISWLFGIARSIPARLHFKNTALCTMGWMGVFVLIGFFFEGFSVDTFGLPYIWIALGVITSIYVTRSHTNAQHQINSEVEN